MKQKEREKAQAKAEAKLREKEKARQQVVNRGKFLALIESLKADGKDPIFNLTSDFTTNEHLGHGTYASIKKVTHK